MNVSGSPCVGHGMWKVEHHPLPFLMNTRDKCTLQSAKMLVSNSSRLLSLPHILLTNSCIIFHEQFFGSRKNVSQKLNLHIFVVTLFKQWC